MSQKDTNQRGGEDLKISVKAARVNSGMLSKDVAAIMGLSINGYSKKENGKSRFYADELATLSNLFQVPFENFFEAECLIKTQELHDAPL